MQTSGVYVCAHTNICGAVKPLYFSGRDQNIIASLNMGLAPPQRLFISQMLEPSTGSLQFYQVAALDRKDDRKAVGKT